MAYAERPASVSTQGSRRERRVVSHVLKVSALKRSTPIAVLVGIKSCDSPFHKALPGGCYARIMISSILNLVAALTA
jgi:hypothetical protein